MQAIRTPVFNTTRSAKSPDRRQQSAPCQRQGAIFCLTKSQLVSSQGVDRALAALSSTAAITIGMPVHRLTLLFAVLYMVCAHPVGATETFNPECDYHRSELPVLAWQDLTGIPFELDCEHLLEPAIHELSVRIREKAWPIDVSTSDALDVEFLVERMRLRQALWQQDIPMARIRLAAALDVAKRIRQSEADSANQDSDQINQALIELNEISDVIDGGTIQPSFSMVALAEPDWHIGFNQCGTPAYFYLLSARLLPSRADALVAIGNSRAALVDMISRQWMPAMQMGVLPARLREFSAHYFGEQRFHSEIELALSSIRLEQTPTGRFAFMNLFVTEVPMPVGKQSQTGMTRFETTGDIADYLRSLLKREQEQ